MPGQGQCTCCTIRAGQGRHRHRIGRDRETEPGGRHEVKPCRDVSCSGYSTAETEAGERHHHARTTAGCGKRSRWQGSPAQLCPSRSSQRPSNWVWAQPRSAAVPKRSLSRQPRAAQDQLSCVQHSCTTPPEPARRSRSSPSRRSIEAASGLRSRIPAP